MRRFALGVTTKELCDYRGNGEDRRGEGSVQRRVGGVCVYGGWMLGGSQAALWEWRFVINFECISLPSQTLFCSVLKCYTLGRR